MKKLALLLFFISAIGLSQEKVPPEVEPRVGGKETKTECPPAEKAKDVIEGKCICEKPECPKQRRVVRIVEKPVIKYKTKEVVKVKYVDKPVEKVVEKVVEKIVTKPADYKKFNITVFYGHGPEGFDNVLYRPEGKIPYYRTAKNYGDIYPVVGTYRITESWNASVMFVYPSNAKAAGVGFSF